ncbi:ciliogenesis and planar polarity effector 2 isoform X2 [Taeniopygia guttata]|uniref:ciliogenesis and planar polarity effector 2 isoform X2 n=1 Tax=Taeniopygia guttata TaxID=59729 RepID=UPI003BB8A69F
MAEQHWALEPGWLLSPAGRPYLDSIVHKNQRRAFGLLERPALPPALAVPTVTYKLFLAGRSGVGKTALVAWLGGTPAPPAHHETLGIEVTTLFWPAKPCDSGRPVLFQLHLWDCGDGALRKFEHLLPIRLGGTHGGDRGGREDLRGVAGAAGAAGRGHRGDQRGSGGAGPGRPGPGRSGRAALAARPSDSRCHPGGHGGHPHMNPLLWGGCGRGRDKGGFLLKSPVFYEKDHGWLDLSDLEVTGIRDLG